MRFRVGTGGATPVVDSTTANGRIEVTLVITTRNRADRLEPTLASLVYQAMGDTPWELVLIDNGSTDGTSAVIEAAARTLPIRCFNVSTPGKTHAQNVAVEQARGYLLVFTDDDVRFAPGWLVHLHRASHEWPEADLFGGAIEPHLVDMLPSWLDCERGRALIDRHCARYAPRSDEGYTETPPIGPNMALRRSVMTDLRFDENVGPDGSQDYIKGGDTDLNQALMTRGLRCVFVPEASVMHGVSADQLKLANLFQGGFRRGRKNAYLYPKNNGLRLFGAPLKLWTKLVKQWWRYRLSESKGPFEHYEAGMKYHYRRGYLAQCRRQGAVSPRARSE